MNDGSTIRLFADAHVFDGGYQGTRSFLQGLYSELARREDVTVYLGAQDCAQLRRCFAGVSDRIRFVPYSSRSRYRRLLWEVPAILKEHSIDYAHFQYLAPPRKVCPYIVTTHDVLFEEMPTAFPFLYRRLRRHWFRRAALQADVLTTVSSYAAQSIAQHYDIPLSRMTIVPNAVAPQDGNASGRQGARRRLRERYGVDRYLLCVSRMEPRKNQHLLVRAFQELNLAAEGYQLVLIGNRSLHVPEFDQALAALKSYERAAVWILENIPDQELQDWYRGCRLFAYPSLGEGFGIPPLEAAMAEVPVLCSNKTALADFDFFGDDLVDPTDTKAFTARLNQLLQTPPQPGIFAQRAQTIANRYSWKASADILMQQVYQHQAQMIRR